MIYRPDPVYAGLEAGFADEVDAADFPETRLRFRNQRAAEQVGLGGLTDEAWLAHFARFEPLPDNQKRPLAMRYHGHQFDVYNPELGDGRGFLFAQLRDDRDRLLDLGTKGSGQTPWSRGGDGRLTLKGGVREVLATELLEALGVNTSRTFSLVETGEKLYRNDEPSPTRSCVMVRLSHSHIRVGSFQRHAHQQQPERVRTLLEHSVEHYHPDLRSAPNLPQAFAERVAEVSGKLCAQWMVAGFVHGVLNSDNQNITGESFDYGPWRFLPEYRLNFTAAYFDHAGLYCYGRQPQAVLNNMERLLDALRILDASLSSETLLEVYKTAFHTEYRDRWLWRLGVRSRGTGEGEPDGTLIDAAVELLSGGELPFPQLFHDWYGGVRSEERALAGPFASAYESEDGTAFRAALAEHETAVQDVPAFFEAPQACALLIDEVEALWAPVAERDDWAPLEAKLRDIRAFGEALRSR